MLMIGKSYTTAGHVQSPLRSDHTVTFNPVGERGQGDRWKSVVKCQRSKVTRYKPLTRSAGEPHYLTAVKEIIEGYNGRFGIMVVVLPSLNRYDSCLLNILNRKSS